MDVTPLAVPGAWVVTPRQFGDERGTFLEWCRPDVLESATGHRLRVAQANHSVSRRGTLRGVHFADVPPGQAKYVYCSRGEVLDVVVDVRRGSPTFGRCDSVRLDDRDRRAVYLAEGLGHAFLALSDEAHVVYLVSSRYDPAAEHEVNALDPDLALPWPEQVQPLLSAKDAAAPGVQAAAAAGLLPDYDACLRRYNDLRHGQ